MPKARPPAVGGRFRYVNGQTQKSSQSALIGVPSQHFLVSRPHWCKLRLRAFESNLRRHHKR